MAFVLLAMLVLYGPLILLAIFSFNKSQIISLPWSGFTTKWYPAAWNNSDLRASLVNSTIVACVVAPTCLVVGTLMSFALTRFRFKSRGLVSGLVAAPLILPWLVIGIAGLLFFAQLQKVLGFFHLSLRTVVATQIVCTFPLVTAIVSAQLLRFDKTQEEAAIDLGASRIQVLRYVILPHITPALAAAGIFAFTWSFNNFEISYFTIGFQQIFPVWAYGTLKNSANLPIINAISTLISVVQVGLIIVAWRILRSRGGGAEAILGSLVADVEPQVQVIEGVPG
ncbi:MAG: spermidine/putrescine transport system permease protein [Actinomycetota bacterium]|nr:spermidine/putrescine transport system permease protein [Actinomycetota bacterium]